MNHLIIVRGLPGSGKTTFGTWLRGLVNMYPKRVGATFSADDFFIADSGDYVFQPDLLGAAHSQCQRGLRAFMHTYSLKGADYLEGIVAIVHNTSTTEKELKPYLELAEEYDYQVTSLIVENRHGNKSVHNVPEEAIDRMKQRFSVKL